MTNIKTQNKPSPMPVIYVHAKGHDQVSEKQVQALSELGLPLFSRLPVKGTIQTTHGYGQPGMLLAELASLHPGKPVLFLRAGMQPSRRVLDQLAEILDAASQPLVLSVLSNAHTAVNPFTGLQAPQTEIKYELADLVKLLAPGNLHTLIDWTDHFAFLSAAAVKCLAGASSSRNLVQQLLAAGGKIQVPDHLFLLDTGKRVFEPLKLEPHESSCPPPFSELSARLQDWLNAEIAFLPKTHLAEKPATLHITHSWGGGVTQWINSFIKTDGRHAHYQLRSELAQSGHAYGQKLSLYAGNELRCPIASWWLQPPIESVVDSDDGYQRILSGICERFQIGRIFLSSLIGHSLDTLRTGLPTLQILHDHFPLWPLLSVNPEPYLQSDGGADLGKALKENRKSRTFLDKDELTWSNLNEAYMRAISDFNVKFVAPGQWVLDLQTSLEPGFADFESKIIPHGFPAMAGVKPIAPKPRKDKRLRLVILGRMQEGKGQRLLAQALPALVEYVQVYLLGTGKSGEAFFGITGVDVVLEYDRSELSALLTEIGPDFAALLSVVPETFSYTLSELQQLHIPVLATRVGSFPDRIEHGKTGWLVDAVPEAIIRQVEALYRKPAQIRTIVKNLSVKKAATPRQMVNAYNAFLPAEKKLQTLIPHEAGMIQVQRAAADYQRSMTDIELQQARTAQKKLSREVNHRSEWAQKAGLELKQEQKSRQKWVAQLQSEINRLTAEFEEKSIWAQKADELLKIERVRGKQLEKIVGERTAWAQKASDELKLEQKNRKKWVAELQAEVKRLTREFESKSRWAQKVDGLLAQERSRGEQLAKEVKERTAWAQKADAELKQEQKTRQEWIGQLQAEIDRLTMEFGEKSQWALELDDALNLERARSQQLETDLQERTTWAQQLNKELEYEQKQREKWVEYLNAEIKGLQQQLTDKQVDLENTTATLDGTREELENATLHLKEAQDQLGERNARVAQLKSDYQTIAEERALILQSTSWKITKPLRAFRRVAKNFILARAWNPLRWPWLISSIVRNLATQGFSGTLRRLQYNPTEVLLKPNTVTIAELVDDTPAPSSFEHYEHPDASIVIPAHNKWRFTAACLQSLAEHKGKYTFEVIVVDDKSSDSTQGHLAQIEGINYLRNRKNLGFVGSCNHGADKARGTYLVLLNNDTQVTEGWLDELIDTFKREPEAGLVGSRLVYPDGSLQESGGMIFSDGSGWNYGRDDDAERPEYLFLRESDYCSGASIAIKTQYFHQLGGFDKRFAPAYYEDTDLAFKVRESGYKVFVQPSSVIVHHEGVTSGTDTSSGMKRYQPINQEKFLDKWQNELKPQPESITNPQDLSAVRHASHHRAKGQILFIDATTPEPDQDSGSVRLTNLLQILRNLGYHVTFFADNRAYTGHYTQDLQKTGIEVLYHPWLSSLDEFFEERGGEYDYIFISRHYIATNYVSLIKKYCPNARFIFDTVDLHYLREQRLAELENSNTLKAVAKQTRRQELAVIKAADATLVVSSVEKGVLAEDAPDDMVHILSNIHYVPGRGKGFSERKDIYFVGGYQHPPNIDAALWFVNDIWPLIHEQLPDMCFHLIGSKAPDEIRALEGNGVVFHGFVESLDPFLNDCRLAVAPLRYGAGVKGKVNMSMAHGQPIVATPCAGEGMFAEHEREFLLAEDAESFAREVVRLYQDEDLWYRCSDASIKNVETHFSTGAARESILSLFDLLSR